jgi:hypothetical protein
MGGQSRPKSIFCCLKRKPQATVGARVGKLICSVPACVNGKGGSVLSFLKLFKKWARFSEKRN